MTIVALAWPEIPERVRNYNAHVGNNIEIVGPASSSLSDLVDIARDADVIMGSYIPVQMIDAAPRLKMVQILHAGISASKPGDADLGFPLSRVIDRNLVLGNIHGNAEAVAEHALAFVMTQAKHIVPATRTVAQAEWLPFDASHYGVMINGSHTTVIGYGHIGQAIATKLANLGGHVTVFRKNLDRLPDHPHINLAASTQLDQAVGDADFVIVACPLTRATYKLVNERVLRAMKPSAFLINIARAAIVDEAALHRALTEQWIAGYASDVWWIYSYGEGEPQIQTFSRLGYHYNVPSRYGIHSLPNVIGTGDRASFTKESLELFIMDALDNIKKFSEDGVPNNMVSISELY